MSFKTDKSYTQTLLHTLQTKLPPPFSNTHLLTYYSTDFVSFVRPILHLCTYANITYKRITLSLAVASEPKLAQADKIAPIGSRSAQNGSLLSSQRSHTHIAHANVLAIGPLVRMHLVHDRIRRDPLESVRLATRLAQAVVD